MSVILFPPGEAYYDIASVAFYKALTDPGMQSPNPYSAGVSVSASTTVPLLFPANLYDIRLGGDASMQASNATITVPISKTIIAIDRAYTIEECGYAGDTSKDLLVGLPFAVWTNADGTQDDTESRLQFVRDHRTAILEKYNLTLYWRKAAVRADGASPISGLDVVRYRWQAYYSRR